MDALIAGVNWVAVGLGTIISFLLGGFWYSPALFGKQWLAGVRENEGGADKQPIPALLLQLAGTFMLAWLIVLAAVNNVWPSALLISLTVFCLMVSASLFAGHSRTAVLVEAGFFVVMVTVISLITWLLV